MLLDWVKFNPYQTYKELTKSVFGLLALKKTTELRLSQLIRVGFFYRFFFKKDLPNKYRIDNKVF